MLGADPLTRVDDNDGVLIRGLEPPPSYVAFVERYLEPLRSEAGRVVGDERDADHLYPDVLTDVAARWTWLELLRTRLSREGAAEEYLRRRLDHRARRWLVEESEPEQADIRVLRDSAYRRPPARSSAAVRLAAHIDRPARPVSPPIVEALLAWWHAYEVRRRRLYQVWIVVAVVIFALAVRYTGRSG